MVEFTLLPTMYQNNYHQGHKGGKSISALSRLTAVGTCPMTPTQPALQNHVTWVQCVQCGKIYFFLSHPHTSTRSPSQIKPEQLALQNLGKKPCWWNIWGQELLSIQYNKNLCGRNLATKIHQQKAQKEGRVESKRVRKWKRAKSGNQETIKSKYYWQQGVGVLCHVTNTQNTNIQSKSK